MRLRETQEIFAQNIAQLILIIFKHGFTCTLGEVWRPPEMAEIYQRQGKGIRDSLHCDRLALDINLFQNGRYLSDTESHRVFGEIWEKMDPRNRWGGRYGDGNHYDMRLKRQDE